jgi:poly(A) polymerase
MVAEQNENHHQQFYAGRWVAKIGDHIVGQGRTADQAWQAAKAAHFKENPEIEYIPTTQPVIFPELVQQVRQIIPTSLPIYLVGGAVRDALLNRPIHDLDFVLPADSLKAGRAVANALGSAYYPLDPVRQTSRVIYHDPDGKRWLLDFALQRGPDIESDLTARDFTMNAIAVNLAQPQTMLDPLGGAGDLLSKSLRLCSPASIEEDPVRILRGMRLAAAYHLSLQEETRQKMRQGSRLLSGVSIERIRDELFRILDGPQPAVVLRALDVFGALGEVLPDLMALKGVEQSMPHEADVYNHTVDTLQRLEQVLNVFDVKFDAEISPNFYSGLLSLRLGRYREKISQHLNQTLTPDRSLRSLLSFAALYHDVGKPQMQKREEGGRIRYIGHEQVGADITIARLQKMNLSNAEIRHIETIISGHMRPLLLAHASRKPTSRVIYRYYRDLGLAGIDICLLALADAWSSYGTSLTQSNWEQHLEVVRTLMEAWWEASEKHVYPPQLIDGDDLKEVFQLPAGPLIGELLEKVREKQAEGMIQDRDQALKFTKEILANRKTE